MERRRRRDARTLWLYFLTIAREFRITLAVLVAAILLGALLHAITPFPQLNGARPTLEQSFFGAWMSLFAQPLFSPPPTWYLEAVAATYPVLGFVVVGEGIVRFGLLMLSRRRGEREWMKVKAMTYRDHVVLCGLGHLGYRVLLQLLALDEDVVCIERDENGRFVSAAKELGVPVLIRDMKDDEALISAGVPAARALLAATNDDIANLEVALDARRMRPDIRVGIRLFDQQLAEKLRSTFAFDSVFSSAALAAPAVAAIALRHRVLAAFDVAGVPTVAAEVAVTERLAGRTVASIEHAHAARVLGVTDGGGARALAPDLALNSGDHMVVHIATDRLAGLG
ncbi:MAG TPA: NAD(P)-binding protein [Haliangiales bacterium]|nr:NAD(P)-binding protein [Haliangiales bacterium]